MRKRKFFPWTMRGYLAATILAAAAAAVFLIAWLSSGLVERLADSTKWKAGGELPNEKRILREMISAYARASSYSDQGTVYFGHAAAQQPLEDTIGLTVAWQRPNLIRIDVTRGETNIRLACDGTRMRCRIHDPEAAEFDRQFLDRAAPAELSIPVLYSAVELLDPARPRELFSALMGLPFPLELTPAGLLVSQRPLEQLIDAADSLVRLEDDSLGDHSCHRIQLLGADGTFVFWIDRSSKLLRRVEYPAPDLVPAAAEDSTGVRPTVVADFVDACWEAVDPRQFQLPRPPKAQRLRYFVLPPPADPSPALGKTVQPYAFTGLDQARVQSGQWANQIAVLLWFQDHAASRAALDELAEVYEKYGSHGKLVFRAICTEPDTAMSHQQVQQLASRWQVKMPVLRDLQACGRDVFHIDKAPTLVIIASDNTIQLVEEGADSLLGEQLPYVLDRLLNGEDLASEYLQLAQRQLRDYQLALESASVDAPHTEVVLPETVIAGRSEPVRWRIQPLWSCRDFTAAGNILVIEQASRQPLIHVVDGWREVVLLGPDGTLRRRHSLNLPDDGAIAFLRSDVNGDGKRYFVGTARLGRQVYLFDQQWQLVLSYPHARQAHEGIQDVQLIDLDRDGSLELYVAFAGVRGIHRVDFTGRSHWRNLAVHSVLSLESPRNQAAGRKLLATNVNGRIVALDPGGGQERPISVANRTIHQLVAGDVTQTSHTSFCGTSFHADGHQLAIGLNEAMREVWSYILPSGTYRTQIQPITAGQLLDRSGFHWLLAAPDGTIHIVADDGESFDSFAYGQPVTGLAAARFGSKFALLVATENEVTALQFEPR